MIIALKKKSLIMIALMLSIMIAFTALLYNDTPISSNGKTVVIDAGHGGADGGVVGKTTSSKESDVNLSIAKKLRDYLVSAGYAVVMTRTGDYMLSSNIGGSRKLRDMEGRKAVIKQASPDLVVSIHQNSFPSKFVRGAQVFYAPGAVKGKEYADLLQQTLNLRLGFDKTAAPGDYYIIRCSDYPSLLVECGFLSNPEEEKKLLNADYQDKMAYTLFSAISVLLTPTKPANVQA